MSSYTDYLDSIEDMTVEKRQVILDKLSWNSNLKPLPKYTKYNIPRKVKEKPPKVVKERVKPKDTRYEHKKTFQKLRWDVKVCQRCWGTEWGLQIHHLNKKHIDNYPLNLIKLCLKCHCEAHKGDKVYKFMKSNLRKSKKTNLDLESESGHGNTLNG